MSMDRDLVAREYIARAQARGAARDLATARAMFAALDDEIPARVKKSPPLSLDERAGEIFWTMLFADGWARLALARDDAAVQSLYQKFRRGQFNRLFDDTRPALDALKSRGLQLGVLSNFTANCGEVLRTLGIANYFSSIVVSALVRAEKPARAIFDHATRESKCAPREIILVGDSIHHDVDGARDAGWDAILLDRDNWYPNYSAAPRIRKLTEIVNLV